MIGQLGLRRNINVPEIEGLINEDNQSLQNKRVSLTKGENKEQAQPEIELLPEDNQLPLENEQLKVNDNAINEHRDRLVGPESRSQNQMNKNNFNLTSAGTNPWGMRKIDIGHLKAVQDFLLKVFVFTAILIYTCFCIFLSPCVLFYF